MLNIVIPIADKGGRFLKSGQTLPKPLIPVHGVPMVRMVIENLRPACAHRFVFVCQRAHLRDHGLEAKLMAWAGKRTEVIELDGVPEGPACAVLGARELIDDDQPLLVAQGDQFVLAAIDDCLAEREARGLDALVLTMADADPNRFAVRLDRHGFADRMARGPVQSQDGSGPAPAGPRAVLDVYLFRQGRDFVRGADAILAEDKPVDGEFPIAPACNALIERGARIGAYDIGPGADGRFPMNGPEELEAFLAQPISKAFAARIG